VKEREAQLLAFTYRTASMNETKNALQSTHMQLLQNQMQDKNQFYWNLANPSD